MIISWRELSVDALQGVLEEFISREGTDYGGGEWSLEDKVHAVQRQLDAGTAVLVYDEDSETCSVSAAIAGKIVE